MQLDDVSYGKVRQVVFPLPMKDDMATETCDDVKSTIIWSAQDD